LERLTAEMKECLAYKILELLKEYELTADVWIYFNSKCLTGEGKVIPDVLGSDKFQYATDDTISMTFEGDFCGVINYRCPELANAVMPKFDALLKSYGLFYEQGHHWNLGTYIQD
jgi:hypothetical protein